MWFYFSTFWQGQDKSLYPVLLAMLSNNRSQLEVDHSLTFMKVISQNAGANVECQDVISDMLSVLLTLCSAKIRMSQVKASPHAHSHRGNRAGDVHAVPVNPGEAMRIKAAAVIRNLASNPDFGQSMCENDELLQILNQLLANYPQASSRQALGALCNLAAVEAAAELIMSFPKIDEEQVNAKLANRENLILTNLLSLTESRDEWTCVQSIITLQNLIEHDLDMCKYEMLMIEKFATIVLERGDVTMQAKIKAALALASLTSRESACMLIAELPENKDTRIFGILLGLEHEDPSSSEVEVGLWALCNIAALDANTEKKFLEVDFLLDRIGYSAAKGTDEQMVAAAATIKNLSARSAECAEYLGSLDFVVESIHKLALSEDAAVYEHAVGALCNLTTEVVKNRVRSVGHGQLSHSTELAAVACRCLNDVNDVLKMYAAGLICNMAASDGDKDTTAEIGKHRHILEHLVACLTSTKDEVRINALSALCNLAHTDINKIHIGQVPGCLDTVNAFLESGTESEKAQASMLVFYLSFTFKNNAAFGSLPGSLDRVVQLLRLGTDEQVENAAAALSILACNKENAEMLTSDEKRASLLQTFASTLKNGNPMQRVNIVVCMWNLSASSAAAKADIGKLPSIFVYLVDILKTDNTSELAQQTAGLVAELLHENHRNCMLFDKVDQSIEMVLELSFAPKAKQVVELNACWAIANFAAEDDERLRRVVEMEGGLTVISRLLAKGDKRQQDYACAILASSVLKSQSGRNKIVRVPGLLASLVTMCTNFEDDRRRYSVEVLNNLAAGPSTRQAVSQVDGIVKALETAVADSRSSKWSQYYATCCLASLCLDPDLADQLGDWEYTHGLLFNNLTCDDNDLVDAAAEAFHNLLASNEDNRETFSDKQELMDRIVELAGVGEGRACEMHAVGGLFQLARASKEFAQQISTHPSLAPKLVNALKSGSDKAKELSCAILAILGENDDDISSVDDDVLNMQIAMCDGSFDALQNLFIRGSPQQALHSTAVLSNLLISAGSFMKTQLAENEDFLVALVKFSESASPLHRTYAVRLLFHMIKEDIHIIQLVGNIPSSIPVLLELLDAGNNDQRSYAILCMVQLASEEEIARKVCFYNKGHIFKIVLQILKAHPSPLKGSALELLLQLTVDDEGKAQVIRIEGLVDHLAQVALKGIKGHSVSAAGILLELSKFSKGVRAQLASESSLAALHHLLQMPGKGRRVAAMMIFHLAVEQENLKHLVGIPDVFEILGQMVVQGDNDDKDSGCCALWKLLKHPQRGLKHLSKASQVAKTFVFMMEEVDESGEPLATMEREQNVLSAIQQMCKDEYGCSVISLVPGVFRMLVNQAAREGFGDGHPWLALSVVRTLVQCNSTCADTLLQEPKAIPVLLASVRASNASLVRDSLAILEMLCDNAKTFQPHIIEANKDKGDVWDTLLSFTDEKLLDDSVFNKAEFDFLRQQAFDILTMLAKGNQVACDRITQKRVCTDIIARGILNVGGQCRQSALKLSIECCTLNEHFAKKLGNERNFLKTLTAALGANTQIEIEYSFSLYDQKLSLSLLMCLSANELHCKNLGATPGFNIALLTLVHEGVDARFEELKELAKITRSRAAKDVEALGEEGDATEAIWKAGADDEQDHLDHVIADGLLHPDLVDDLEDRRHLDIEAAGLVRTLILNNFTCNAFVRVPYPLVETLIMQVLALQAQQRKHALAIIWTISLTSKHGLELLGKKAVPLMQALLTICQRRKQHLEEVLPLLADLMHDKKCKVALYTNAVFMQLLVDMMGRIDQVNLASKAIRTLENLAQDFNEGKPALGERQDLMKILVKLKHTGTDVLAKAASAAMEQLSKDCDQNAGIFRRLRVEYAR